MRIADEILTGQQTDNTATLGVGYPESYPGPVAPLGQTEASQATTYHTQQRKNVHQPWPLAT